MFDPERDDGIGTLTLVRLLVANSRRPVIAAGGIMDGAGIAAALLLGASAVQLGTAFVLCPESAADAAYRERFKCEGANHTRITSSISGRPRADSSIACMKLPATPHRPTIPWRMMRPRRCTR